MADDAPCEPAWSELTSPSGEVTFTRDGHVFSFDPATGDLRCLATVDRDPSALDWNPAGDRLLVDEDLIVTAEDQHASGFDPGTTGISWSQPAGTALIAPNADGTALRHISATNAADSSLRMTWAAAYHPSGLAIVSAGIDDNGVAGLFIADNLGNGPQTLVFLEDPATTITEVAFAHNGDWVTCVHDHTDGTIDEGVAAHIHRIHLPDLLLEDVIAQVDVVPQQLVASEQVDGSIAWQETHSTVNHQTFAWSGGDVVSLGFPETEVVPVGFVDGGTAVAKVRSDGTPRETAG